MNELRAFIALPLEDRLLQNLTKLQDLLRRTGADVNWVKPGSIHLTLAFLGPLRQDEVQELIRALDRNLPTCTPLNLTAAGTGTFGRKHRPTVIWAGIKENPALQELEQKIRYALQTAGIAYDARPFTPHLTLGRVKSNTAIDTLLKTLKDNKTKKIGRTRIEAVHLMNSTLTPTGAEYSILHQINLSQAQPPEHRSG